MMADGLFESISAAISIHRRPILVHEPLDKGTPETNTQIEEEQVGVGRCLDAVSLLAQ